MLDILKHGDNALIPLLDKNGKPVDFMMIDGYGNMQTTGGQVGGIAMNEINNDLKKNSLKLTINDKLVTLTFAPEPNLEVAELIKKTLITSFLIKKG